MVFGTLHLFSVSGVGLSVFGGIGFIVKNSEPYSFEATLEHETDGAYLLIVDGEKVWFPKSMVTDDGGDWWTTPEYFAIEKEIV